MVRNADVQESVAIGICVSDRSIDNCEYYDESTRNCLRCQSGSVMLNGFCYPTGDLAGNGEFPSKCAGVQYDTDK